MKYVRPKKHLGQHFLRDEHFIDLIITAFQPEDTLPVLEIGPGSGALTKDLLSQYGDRLWLNEIDRESISFLEAKYPEVVPRLIKQDFLKTDLQSLFPSELAVIGNFPYNISSQILFHVLKHKNKVPLVCGMFQEEVARRICANPGNKTYGIISVFIQAWYDTTYLFTVPPEAFLPPPKVFSGVIQLTRKESDTPVNPWDKIVTLVKTAFNQRRKTLRNSLKSIEGVDKIPAEILQKRPEQLGWKEFDDLATLISS